jgi:hypothetical protein
MTLAHASASAGKQCAGCSKFPTYIDYNAHGIPIQHRAIKGTPVISLNTVTRAVHICLLARQIHNAHTLPTATTTLPARLRRSLPARLCASLPTAALLFSSPIAPCVMTVTRTRLPACGRLPIQPKDGWRESIIPGHDDEPTTSGHELTWIRPLRPSREQRLHSWQRLVLLEPLMPSLFSATKSAIYSCQCGL